VLWLAWAEAERKVVGKKPPLLPRSTNDLTGLLRGMPLRLPSVSARDLAASEPSGRRKIDPTDRNSCLGRYRIALGFGSDVIRAN